MSILKMWLKQSLSYSKWVFQGILSLTFLSNCISSSSNYDTAFLPDCTKFLSFFRLLDKKFYEDFKNVLKTVIFFLQMGFPGDSVPDCPFKLYFC